MKGILIFLLTIGLFLLSASAEGANWKFILTDKHGKAVYIDTESIRHVSKTVVRAWTKTILKNPEPLLSKEIIEALGYEEHDCAEMKWNNLEILFRYSDGTSGSATIPAKE